MSEEENNFFERCFGIVASLKVENENQVIAKEVVLDEIRNLQQENSQLKDKLEKVKEYVIKEQRTLLDCEVVYTDTLLKILKGDK